MITLARLFGHCVPSAPWTDRAPVREELFGIERLEQHAQSLAVAQSITLTPPRVLALQVRLSDNARVLLAAYRAIASELEHGREVVPAAEWLLDNYHVVEEQVREVRDDLPPGYYRQLPKLATGPLAGYPRVLGLAWAFVAHTDSHFEPATLRRFIDAYQRVQPLTIGELWAVAITLRIVLIENLRRLADQIGAGRLARADADELAARLLVPGKAYAALRRDIASRAPGPLSELFAAQLAQRLRDQDPSTTPALGWLVERLAAQDTTVERVVRHAQQRQGASNVTVRNAITSLRLMSDIDWADLFESVSLVDARLGAASDFNAMDFSTRDLYRSAIEQLARGSARPELEIAGQVLAAAQAARHAAGLGAPDAAADDRPQEPGYYLIAEGRAALESSIGFHSPARLWLGRLYTRMGLAGYASAILATTGALLWLAWCMLPAASPANATLGWWLPALWLTAAFLPATEVATACINRWIAWRCVSTPLPAMELAGGVPAPLRTLVAVPSLMSTPADLLEQIERLEVHYLASGGGDMSFALLLDGLDAPQADMPGDAALLGTAVAAVTALNLRHGTAPGGSRFLLLHRKRLFNAAEQCWMGWERKRGKLHELNRLLRGARDTSFEPLAPDQRLPDDIVYVITLDADTQLPRDAARQLVGKMAHPLNRPRFSTALRRVVGGHAVLQPRVTPSLPLAGDTSPYQRASSGPGGLDPYARTASDIYQDLFGEGSYTGKGIYHVDTFEAALAGRVADNTLLSHDLFEGVFARAGLASDVDLVEEAVARYDVDRRRQHRWTRGDWQLLPWLLAWPGTARSGTPAIGRWKMLDNLRRSLIAPSTLLALGFSWLLPLPAAATATLVTLALIAAPALLGPLLDAFSWRTRMHWRAHARRASAELQLAGLRTVLAVAFLGDRAWQAADAIIRTLWRLAATRRHLLEWTAAAQSARGPRPSLSASYRQMAGGTAAGAGIAAFAAGAALLSPSSGGWSALLPLPFALAWLAAPAIALQVSRPRRTLRGQLRPDDARALRLIARRTWRFFETFVTPADHMLPPDNFQEEPGAALARRTSPTNIGLYLLSAVAARDFGWAGTRDTVERLEATFATLAILPRFKGHFYNWYDTADLRALDPHYVSSVDSGNLAGHLVALANACEEWLEPASVLPDARAGMRDSLQVALETIATLPSAQGAHGARLAQLLADIEEQLYSPLSIDTLAPILARLADKAASAARALAPADDEASADLVWWIESIGRCAASHGRDIRDAHAAASGMADSPAPAARLQAVAEAARAIALGMDFAFLLDPERRLLSIGYAAATQTLDTNCYDLLASEARLASLFAIAKGDVPTRHWFRLGRAATPVGHGSALISWSGSMFEYLMPPLVMRAPTGSLLEQTSRLAVERQIEYAHQLGVPWGISESSYNARDLEFTYQYSNFGVPGLGLKRGLAENLVIAPYATGLAAMIDARLARQNYARLAALGMLGRHGFYEALDFTASRVPEGDSSAIVRSYMAHHQGMTIVALANTLHGGRMRSRFHREPLIRSVELLLQERMPRDVALAHPRAEEVRVAANEAGTSLAVVRRLTGAALQAAPVTQLLSNGRYAVMLTAAGAGYTRWRGMAVTRWQEDATRDPWGSFIYLRDALGGEPWCASARPLALPAADYAACEVVFGEDHATFTRHIGPLTTTMDVLVSGEDDGEVRRISVANSGRRARDIDITSYAEIVLAPQSADDAHPAFSKLFVITEHLPEFGALIATRRPRTPEEPSMWAGHFAVVEAELMAAPQHTSDRAGFLGRGRDARHPQAITADTPLDSTTGTVLDAVFSLRRRVRVPPGGLARVSFWTLVASSRAALIDLIDRHHDRSAFERAKTLAWTQAQVQLHHLAIHADEAGDFQRLAAPILYADARFRAPQAALVSGAAPQSGLWPLAISGDLPIVLLRISEVSDLPQVRQLLRAHEYWRLKQLAVDLVIVNERRISYTQELQDAIDTAVRSSQARPRAVTGFDRGGVHVLRAELMEPAASQLLHAAARVVIASSRGPLRAQLDRTTAPAPATQPASATSRLALLRSAGAAAAAPSPSTEAATAASLEFFNGLGGFDDNGREYVVQLRAGQTTPAPWINVISNPGFGFQVSADGSGCTWADNSRENQLTPWSNDPVTDPAGEALYVQDDASGEVWTATAQPIRDDGLYEARHGHGFSRFRHEAHGISLDLLQYVPLADPVKLSRLTLRNVSDRPRRLSVTSYAEWVLGSSRAACAPFIVTQRDAEHGALLARRPWSVPFGERVAFSDLGGRQRAWTADRTEFLGPGGHPGAPAALLQGRTLSGSIGAGLDPCAALQCRLTLEPGASVEVVALLGQAASAEDAARLIAHYRAADLDAVLAEVNAHWRALLGAVQVKTPDRAMDILLNGWLLYQTVACRLQARSAFYQSSGAYGFRDQLQDGMALAFAQPGATRAHLLRAAGRQFPEGDVQHWWLPHSGQGVRTRISDDRVWLAYAAASYVASSGDGAVLEERVPFIDGPALRDGEHDAFFQAQPSQEAATLYEHCARGLDQCLQLTSARGLPLIGIGDWNDGMNRVGAGGQGESVWLGWLLLKTLALFTPFAWQRGDARAARWDAHAEVVRTALERYAWDGAWYRRATFDDGSWLGGQDSDECRIDSIAQSWAVLSGAAQPERATTAMASLQAHLVRPVARLAPLFWPPFDHTPRDPGYIKGYPPGLRENAGQYTHAATWAVMAFAHLGRHDEAAALWSMLNPVNHGRTPADVVRYKVEPYVVAADVYSVAPHQGRGGWTWYTGSAAWMYRAALESILGIRREGRCIVVQPRIPADWPGFEATVTVERAVLKIHLAHAAGASGHGSATSHALLDGVELPVTASGFRAPLQDGLHSLCITWRRAGGAG